jgi:hypothetical protein
MLEESGYFILPREPHKSRIKIMKPALKRAHKTEVESLGRCERCGTEAVSQ